MHEGASPPAADVPTTPDAGARCRLFAGTASDAIVTVARVRAHATSVRRRVLDVVGRVA